MTFVTDKPERPQPYAIEPTEIGRELGGRAGESFESGLIKTVDSYPDNERWAPFQRGGVRGSIFGKRRKVHGEIFMTCREHEIAGSLAKREAPHKLAEMVTISRAQPDLAHPPTEEDAAHASAPILLIPPPPIRRSTRRRAHGKLHFLPTRWCRVRRRGSRKDQCPGDSPIDALCLSWPRKRRI